MSDLDDLMDLDPLNLSKQNLDAIIQYHRNNRARAEETTAKGRKAAAGAPKPKINLEELFNKPKAEVKSTPANTGWRR